MPDRPDESDEDAAPLNDLAHYRLDIAGGRPSDGQSDRWWSVLLMIDGSIDEFIADATALCEKLRRGDRRGSPARPCFLVPVAYDPEDRRHRPAQGMSQPLVIFATHDFVDKLNRRDVADRCGVAGLYLGTVIDRDCLDFEAGFPPAAPIGLPDDAVVMAVIDDGIGLSHDLFRGNPLSSRIEYAAIMGARAQPGGSGTTCLGRSFDRQEIDRLLHDCTSGGLVDEDLFQTRTGQVEYGRNIFSAVALRRSHGTHTMGLAAGWPMDDAPGNRPILCAELPWMAVGDVSGTDLLPHICLALQMLLNQAGRFRRQGHGKDRAPVVINLSYGNTSGPHDGTGLYARIFEHYVGPDGKFRRQDQTAWLTLPAGNSNEARLHAMAENPVDEKDGHRETVLDLTVLPDDRTASHVEIWLPAAGRGDGSRAEIRVVAPTGETWKIRAGRQRVPSVRDDARPFARLSWQPDAEGTAHGMALLAINPTASLDPHMLLAPSGQWKISLRGAGGFHARIRRDETLPGHHPGGRQAFFSNPCYRRFGKYGEPRQTDPKHDHCPVRREGTISGYACGPSPVVVGAFTRKEAGMSDYSAAGPLSFQPASPDPHRQGPDLAARGDDSIFRRGVRSAGSKSGTSVRESGTSSSAPRVARAAAGAIGTPGLSGRSWAEHPAGLTRIALQDDPGPERAGSGAWAIPVTPRWPG